MNVDDQLAFLINLGKRLERLCSPGDREDYIGKDMPLWGDFEKRRLIPPVRVSDLLLARWFQIKDYSSPRPVWFGLNAAQLNFSRSRRSDAIVLKAGRAGFTTREIMQALLHTMCIPGYTSVLVAHALASAGDYFMQARNAYENLGGLFGKELREGALQTQKKNTREIYFPALNSHMFIDTAGQFAPAEGESIQYLICDEFARWKTGDPKQVVGTLLSHVTGDNTTTTLMSRPFGQAGEFYERYWAARRGDSVDARAFGAHFYQWWWNQAQTVGDDEPFALEKEEHELCERYTDWALNEAPKDCGLPMELSYPQLRWRREMKGKLGDLFPQEFADNETGCFLGSGNCPFDAMAISTVLGDRTPVLERQQGQGETENGLMVWRDPNPNHWYILFIDPAGTLFSSRVAMEVVDGDTWEQCAEWVGRGDATTCAHTAFALAQRFGRVIIAVETNLGEVSATMMAELVGLGLRGNGWIEKKERRLDDGSKVIEEHMHEWPRLFRHQDSGGQWQLGWKTDSGNRPEMLSNFGNHFRGHPERFHSARLTREVKACVRNGDRIEAGKGMTDDLVMAYAGALKVIGMSSVVRAEPMAEFIPTGPASADTGKHWVKAR